MKKILVVDYHQLVGEGTKLMIEQETGIDVHFETSSIKALDIVKTHTFDLMIFGLHMPEMDGFELTIKVLKQDHKAKILIYTEDCRDFLSYMDSFFESGAIGIIPKSDTKDYLIMAINCALNEKVIIPSSFLKELYFKFGHSVQINGIKEKILLNEKEKKILIEIGKGRTNKVIAQTLYISQRSLEYSLTKLFRKLGVHTRLEAVMIAKEKGLVKP